MDKLLPDPKIKPTLSVGEVAEIWDLSRFTVYTLAKEGGLPVAPLRIGRSLRWPTKPVLASVGLDEPQ